MRGGGVSELPVAVIGAGPEGLAAAAHLLEGGLEPLVLEAGDGPAPAVREWGHVRLFSPWPELVDKAAARLLEPSGWAAPESGCPTGAEWVDRYLDPLAGALGRRVRYGARVTGVSRKGRDRLVDVGRSEQPFTVHIASSGGEEERLEARAVIDASGTWRQPNPAGADGLPALGEHAAAGLIRYQVPDSAAPGPFAGKHTVVLGAGHSAATAVVELARIAAANPGTTVTWVLRRGVTGATFGGGAADQLPERGALGLRARQAVTDGLAGLVTGFRTGRIRLDAGRAVLVAEDGRKLPPADAVVVLTGFRPDLSFLSEMRLDLDPVLQAPRRIAPGIDPNVHSCGTATPTLARDLAHPEPGLYLVGMKSYGRAPTFLAMTGYEQVRSVAAELAGDHAAAARSELVLPDTGVCSGSGLGDDPDGASAGGCCAPAPQVLQIGLAPVRS
jgi:thioredoxin reductase